MFQLTAKSNGLEVVQVFPEEGNMGRVLPKYLSQWTTDKVKAEGVQVLPNSQVTKATLDGEKIVLSLQNGQEVIDFLSNRFIFIAE
jgi:programmed cell death 8 (apoptosis-inducing factor)